MLLELIAERGKDMLAALGVEQLDLTGEHIDILVGLTRLAATTLVNLDNEDGRVDALDGAMRSTTRVRPMLALTLTRSPTISVSFSWMSST